MYIQNSMSDNSTVLKKYRNSLSWKNRLGRLLWNITSFLLFRPFVSSLFTAWRIFLLRCFGAKIAKGVQVYSSARIWAPWNLVMEEYACIASRVDCYNVDKVVIGRHATISQGAYLCTASHDITLSTHPLITAPIKIEDYAWVATDAFVSMGVTIGQGAVVGARACVYKDVESWYVVGGNPAKFIKKREVKSE